MKQLFKLFLIILACFTFVQAFPRLGDDAPDFTIYNYTTQEDWTLSDYIGEKVICLISGSFC